MTDPVIYTHDGYTAHGYIAAVAAQCPELRFEYRPVLSQDRAVIDHEIRNSDPRKQESLAAQVMAKHVQSWNLQRPESLGSEDMETIPLEVSDILCIAPTITDAIYQIVMGRVTSDEDPKLSDEERNEQTASAFDVALSGTSPEDHAAKNSETG